MPLTVVTRGVEQPQRVRDAQGHRTLVQREKRMKENNPFVSVVRWISRAHAGRREMMHGARRDFSLALSGYFSVLNTSHCFLLS